MGGSTAPPAGGLNLDFIHQANLNAVINYVCISCYFNPQHYDRYAATLKSFRLLKSTKCEMVVLEIKPELSDPDPS